MATSATTRCAAIRLAHDCSVNIDMSKKPRTRPDGRSRTFESRYRFYLDSYRRQVFGDDEPNAVEQSQIELVALLATRLERHRLAIFEGNPDADESVTVSLGKAFAAALKPFGGKIGTKPKNTTPAVRRKFNEADF